MFNTCTDKVLDSENLITGQDHDWSKPFVGGPQDIGFAESYITPSGIQGDPYAFFDNGYLEMDPSDAIFWNKGSYDMPHGVSEIPSKNPGEGSPDWDSTAYNQILVNKTADFIDSHLENRPDDPMFMYVALGSVRL